MGTRPDYKVPFVHYFGQSSHDNPGRGKEQVSLSPFSRGKRGQLFFPKPIREVKCQGQAPNSGHVPLRPELFPTPGPSPVAAKRTKENSQETQGPLLGSGRCSGDGGEIPGLGLGKGSGEAESPGSRAQPSLLHLASPPPSQFPHSSLPLTLGTKSTKKCQVGPSRATAWSGVQDPGCCLPGTGDQGSSMSPSPPG